MSDLTEIERLSRENRALNGEVEQLSSLIAGYFLALSSIIVIPIEITGSGKSAEEVYQDVLGWIKADRR